MNLRKGAIALAVTGASLMALPVTAGAKTTDHAAKPAIRAAHKSASGATTSATSFKKIPVTGASSNGKAFRGHLNVTQFVTRHGKTFAVGTLTGRLGNRIIKSTQVAVPASLQQGSSTTGTGASAAAACPILHLVLGPLHLNLLGLHVNLNQVNLNITAVPGAGNLLGNLLCGVANLLNGTPVTGANLTGLLNIVQQLVGTPGLLGL